MGGVFVGISLPLEGAGVSPDKPKPPYYGHPSASSLGTHTQMHIHTCSDELILWVKVAVRVGQIHILEYLPAQCVGL